MPAPLALGLLGGSKFAAGTSFLSGFATTSSKIGSSVGNLFGRTSSTPSAAANFISKISGNVPKPFKPLIKKTPVRGSSSIGNVQKAKLVEAGLAKGQGLGAAFSASNPFGSSGVLNQKLRAINNFANPTLGQPTTTTNSSNMNKTQSLSNGFLNKLGLSGGVTFGQNQKLTNVIFWIIGLFALIFAFRSFTVKSGKR